MEEKQFSSTKTWVVMIITIVLSMSVFVFISFQITPSLQKNLAWLKSPVIAHAGGCVRDEDRTYYYSNSKESLAENYDLGCRVFEFDLSPTSDGKLALIHDWRIAGNAFDEPLSSEEWLDYEIFGDIRKAGGLTPMLFEDLLDEMIARPDMFVVTDTKSNLYKPEEALRHFQIIYEEAMKKDPALLDRIIPQVYDEKTYEMVRSIYHFPGMIFTCYSTPWKGKEIVEFCKEHDDIKAVTAQHSVKRLSDKSIKAIHDAGLKFYYHTVYTYEELVECFEGGADGVYTAVYTPEDLYRFGLIKTLP